MVQTLRKRDLHWRPCLVWTSPLNSSSIHKLISDYYQIKRQIESEQAEGGEDQLAKSYHDLTKLEHQARLKHRLKKYCQKAYKRVLDKPTTELREVGICMRENPFYVDTVRSFRDRRYE